MLINDGRIGTANLPLGGVTDCTNLVRGVCGGEVQHQNIDF